MPPTTSLERRAGVDGINPAEWAWPIEFAWVVLPSSVGFESLAEEKLLAIAAVEVFIVGLVP